MSFITASKERWGIEPICRVLQFAPSTYHAAVIRTPSVRKQRDELLKAAIQRVWEEHRRVYGADKVWAQLKREGVRVARCTVERLMRELGLRGVVRGKTVRTTWPDDTSTRPMDLVERQFRAPAPNALWVADLTYVKTHSDWVYVAFIIDVFSRFIVGWQASRSLRADLALDALEMAIWLRGGNRLAGLVHRSDRGVQYTSLAFARVCDVLRVRRSMGATASCLDNAVAESFWGTLKRKLGRCWWPTRADARRAVFHYISAFYNRQRRHSALGYLTPQEAMNQYTRRQATAA